jgi:vacuolar-type H+-ATPase subunit I/STV1
MVKAKLKKFTWGKKGYVIINIIGGIGYLVLLFGYILFASVLAMAIIPEITSGQLITPDGSSGGGSPAAGEYSLLATVITYIITGLALIVSAFILVVLPYWIGRTGSSLVSGIVKFIKSSPSLLNTYVVKMFISILPFILVTTAVIIVDTHYAFELLVAAAISSFVSVVIFSIQSTIAVIKNRNVNYIW